MIYPFIIIIIHYLIVTLMFKIKNEKKILIIDSIFIHKHLHFLHYFHFL